MQTTEEGTEPKGSDDSQDERQDTGYVTPDREFDFYLASNQLLLDEIRDQHSETINLVNSLVQRSGIIMAFNSVFLIELFSLQSIGSPLWIATTVATLLGMSAGLITVIWGRRMSPGTRIDKIVKTYNDQNYKDLVPAISNGKLGALNKSVMIVELVSNLILVETAFLLVSVIGLVILEV